MSDPSGKTSRVRAQRVIEMLSSAKEAHHGLDWEIVELVHPDRRYSTPPRYTTSLDEALTLVPEGWCWDAGSGGERYIYGPWARVYPNDHRGQSAGTGNQNAATTALAMCMAALKAREIADAK